VITIPRLYCITAEMGPSEQPETEQRQETVAANGIRTIVEYITNDDGKKVKVCEGFH
jgi:hypothetical protein